jgi:hypothetical protein
LVRSGRFSLHALNNASAKLATVTGVVIGLMCTVGHLPASFFFRLRERAKTLLALPYQVTTMTPQAQSHRGCQPPPPPLH